MKKINLLTATILATTSFTPVIALTSCNNGNIQKLLESMPRVSKVEKLSDNPRYLARYMVYFNHPIDWKHESGRSFTQRVEFDFRGLDRVNQLFTCGYELRQEKPDRMNDFELADHFQGNIIKPEYRFYDESKPDGLTQEDVAGWQYLNNTQAVEDFHSIITAFKTILSGKWAFSGTSKGGETTNAFCSTYPDDCAVYVPYVAPKFYSRGDHAFQQNVYGNIGVDVLGSIVAHEYQVEVSKFQLYALQHKKDKYDDVEVFEHFWNKGAEGGKKFSRWANENHEIVYDVCIQECATSFWQYNQDISTLKTFNNMTDGEDKLKECVRIATDLNDHSSYSRDSLFFPYYYQAATEMGEYSYDFKEMVEAIAKNTGEKVGDVDKLLKATSSERDNLNWKLSFNDAQYEAWIVNSSQDMTFANKLIEWNKTTTANVFMIYGGADTWTALRLNENEKSPSIRVYFGQDASNARGRTHFTRISSLSPAQQKEIWPQIEQLLK